MRRMRSTTVAGAFTAVLAASVLTGCSSEPEPTHTRICVDPETEIRVEDDECERVGPTRYAWFYYPVHLSGPPVGSRIVSSQGSYTKPAGGVQALPRSGGFGTYRGSTGG